MTELSDIRAGLADLQRAMGRVESNVETLLARDRGFDKRLRKLEHKVTWFSGAAAVLGALFGWAANWFTKTVS